MFKLNVKRYQYYCKVGLILLGLTGYMMKLSLLFSTAQSQNQIPSITTSYAQVKEDTPINEYAFQIETFDPDPVPDPLTYMITGTKSIYFYCDENTGTVTIRTPLERDDDDKGVFSIGLVVSDADYTVSKDIQIIVIDANDNQPIFENTPYNVNVTENTALDTVLFRVYAKDADAGLAAVVKYSIDEVSPTNGLSHFTINENNGDVKLVKQLSFTSLSTFYRLKIKATVSSPSQHFSIHCWIFTSHLLEALFWIPH
uniref:Cadherin domain-containing protein n=1 Tax=Hucho hucho TaxID=62062 RepID=A0A4W5JVJ6_9TELE